MMRISTSQVFATTLTSIQDGQSRLVKLQQQLSTGRRVMAPADDPVAAARVLELQQSSSRNSQFVLNAENAEKSLALTDTQLNALTGILQDVKTLAVNAGDSTLTTPDLKALGVELEGVFREMLGVANATDGNGLYLFSGYQGTTKPFAETTPGTVAYYGDSGQRLLQITDSRQISISENGSDVFLRPMNGNGVFATGFVAANTGSGVISPGSVSNATALTGNNYQINFTVTPSPTGNVTTYDVVNTTTATTVLSAQPFTSGAGITFDGMTMNVEGSPANGDAFTVQPSTATNVFTTLNNLITAVNAGRGGDESRAELQNHINTALSNIDNALDNVLSVRSGIGARMRESDVVRNLGADLEVQYESHISELRDLDYAKAISDFTFLQTNLEAAMKTFERVQGLSLFQYL